MRGLSSRATNQYKTQYDLILNEHAHIKLTTFFFQIRSTDKSKQKLFRRGHYFWTQDSAMETDSLHLMCLLCSGLLLPS